MKTRRKIAAAGSLFLVAIAAVLLTSHTFAQTKSPCSGVDSADVAAMMGEPVKPPMTESSRASSTCRFLTVNPPLKSISVMFQPRTSDAKQLSPAERLPGAKNVTRITGVGDEAAWGSMNLAGRTICELSARKGDSVFLLLLIGGLPDDAATLERARILAQKLLSTH